MNVLNNVLVSRLGNVKDVNQSVSVNAFRKTPEYKPDFIDRIGQKVVNPRDIEDMVTVPRNIFKGYLFFTVGGVFNGISSMFKNVKASKSLNILGSLMTIVGTYNFVKPFLVPPKKTEEK